MIACPLMSNPDVARDFNQLKEVVGEKAAYDIWSKNNGNNIETAPNGEPSILYQDLLEINGGLAAGAILDRAKIFTKSFINKFGNWLNIKTPFQDKNGEPISQMIRRPKLSDELLEYHLNLSGRLRITKGKLKSKHDNLSSLYEDFDEYVQKLIGISLFEDVDKFDYDSLKISDIYDRIDHITGNIYSILQNKRSEVQDQLKNKTTYGEWYISNMLAFLNRNITDTSEYDKITQQRFKQFFPLIFKENISESQRNKYFGYYKHQLMSKKGKTYNQITSFIESHNLQKVILHQKLNKLQKIIQLLETRPNLQDKFKNKLYNQFQKYLLTLDTQLDDKAKYSDKAFDYYLGKSRSEPVDFINGVLKTKNSIKQLVNIVYNFTPDGEQKQYIKLLIDTLNKYNDSNAYFVKCKKYNVGGTNLLTSDRSSDIILLNTDSSFYNDMNTVIIHEATHYVTTRYLIEHPKLRHTLREYVKYLNQYNNSNLVHTNIHGFLNEREFIAEFISKQDFRDMLKYIPSVDEQKFSNAFENIIDIIGNSMSINSHDQIQQIVFKILDVQPGYTYDEMSYEKTKKSILSELHKDANIDDIMNEIYSDENEDENIQQTNDVYVSNVNKLDRERDDFVVNALREQMKNNQPIDDISKSIISAKTQWCLQKQQQIMQSTQLQLAQAFGLHKQEDGTWKTANGKDSLLVQFFEYLDDVDGYYDYNTKSTNAHHVIGIALNSADPTTFNHELAHHYLRMFWRSSLVQAALKAVDKKGMTDEEREEALIELITMKTTENQFVDNAHNDSFFAHFWTKFGSMLYKTFNIQNKLTRTALLNNVARAFAINEQQKIITSKQRLYNMADQRMFKKKSVTQKISDAKRESIFKNNVVNYTPLLMDKTQSAIKNIIQGTVSRNKSFRKTQNDPIILMNMQLAEDEVRQFMDKISKQREQYRKTLNKKYLSRSDKEKMSHTEEELNANIILIKNFIDRAYQEIEQMGSLLQSAESNMYKQLMYIEHKNPFTGETEIEYIDSDRLNDPNFDKSNLQIQQVTFKELQEYRQNTIEYYRNVINKLNKALCDPSFIIYYGQDVQQQLLDAIKGTQSKLGIETLISDCINTYDNAIIEHITSYVNNYIDENTDLDDLHKERMKYSIRTWIEDQNVFGDISGVEVWVGLTQHSKSPLIRLLGDVIENIENDKYRSVNDRGQKLDKLRKKAIQSYGGKFKDTISNIERMFMERDDDGYTGNFATEVNYGKFYHDLNKFLNIILQGKDGIEQQIATRLGDKKYEIEIDDKGNVIFPEGCEDIEKNFLHKINHWYGDHCVRRFTTAYYDARIDILSPATIKARNELDNKINAIRNSLPEGPTRTDLLPVNKQRELLRLERQKAQMSSIYDSCGRLKEKGTIERQIADELTKWNIFTRDKIKYKLDEESYKAAYDAAANKELFENNNTYTEVNPQIWDKVAKIFGTRNSEELEELQTNRRKLLQIIKLRGLSYPDISRVFDLENGKIREGFEEFWQNLKNLDIQISKERAILNKKNKVSKSDVIEYQQLLGKTAVMYEQANGLKIPFEQKIAQSIMERLEREYPNDPNNHQRLAQEMNQFYYTDEKGKQKPLSIFYVTAPRALKVDIDGVWVDGIIKTPTQLYSIIDVEGSNKMWIDDRYDENDKHTRQPFTEKTSNNGISYTNNTFEEIQKNKALKDYYDALVETMNDSYKLIPFLREYDYRLPQIGASSKMYGWRHPFAFGKNFGYMWNRNFTINETDTDINNDFELRPDGTRSMNIPIRYIQRLEDSKTITSDVFGSVMRFYEMAINYNLKSKKLPLFQTVIDKLKSNNTTRQNQLHLLQGIVNRQFYGRTRGYDTDDMNPTVNRSKISRVSLKLLPIAKSLFTTGLLSLSMFPAIINYLDPFLSMSVEAFSSKYMRPWEFISGLFAGLCALPSALLGTFDYRAHNIGNGYQIIPTAINYFDLHNEGSNKYNRTDKTRLGRLFSSEMLMSPFSLGEYTICSQIVGVTFQQYRYYNGKFYNLQQFIDEMNNTGQMTTKEAIKYFRTKMRHHTLFSAYKAKNGSLIKANNEYGNAITEEFEDKLKKFMRNRMGIYLLKPSSTEHTKLQSNVLYSYSLVMRTFMLAGIWERFKSLRDFQIEDDTLYDENERTNVSKKMSQENAVLKGGYNFMSGLIEDGSASRAFSALIDCFIHRTDSKYLKYLSWVIKNPTVSQYSDETKQKREQLEITETDIYSGKRAALETLVILGLMGMSILFHNKVAIGDPDDWKTQVIDLLIMRLGVERLTWWSPDTIMDIITSITAAKGDLDKKMHIIDIFKDIIYRINKGEWEENKGYGPYQHKTKVFKDLMYTFSSLGTHNIYSSLTPVGVKQKIKWYEKLSPVSSFFVDVKEAKRRKKEKEELKNRPTENLIKPAIEDF